MEKKGEGDLILAHCKGGNNRQTKVLYTLVYKLYVHKIGVDRFFLRNKVEENS